MKNTHLLLMELQSSGGRLPTNGIWWSTSRIKIGGQLLGLAWMAARGTGIGNNSIGSNSNSHLRGGAMIMAANMAFFLCGGGEAVNDANGDHTPMPSSLTRSILMIDTILVGSACK